MNFFLPSQKLQEKIRRGSRVTKRYDRAQTSYHRVLASPQVPSALKQRLREQYESLNPAQLYRNLCRLQEQLLRLNAQKQSARAVDGAGPDGKACGFPTGPWKPPAAVPTPPTTPAIVHSPEGKI